MYRRWKKSDQPKEKQAPARETANEAALKRDEPVGEACRGSVDITTVHSMLGRPVASAG